MFKGELMNFGINYDDVVDKATTSNNITGL